MSNHEATRNGGEMSASVGFLWLRRALVIGVLCLAAPAAAAQAAVTRAPASVPAVSGLGTSSAPTDSAPLAAQSTCTGCSTIYNQIGPSDSGAGHITSQSLPDIGDTSTAADDFSVPAGSVWSLRQVNVTGTEQNGGPDASDQVNVTVYADAGGLPGTVVASRPAMAATGDPSFTVPISPAVGLGAGHYWISVQVNRDCGAGLQCFQWFWNGYSGAATGAPASWENLGFGIDACVSWCQLAANVPGAPRDLSFALLGTSQSVPLLYAQIGTDDGLFGETTSDNLSGILDSRDDQAADDFTVPAGQVWTVENVDVAGGAPSGGTSQSMHVIFYADDAGKPGAPVSDQNGLAFTNEPNDHIPLPTGVTLQAGKYWLSVIANRTGGEWFWADSGAAPVGSHAMWENPKFGWQNPGCLVWCDRSASYGDDPSSPDQAFALGGVKCTTAACAADTTPPSVDAVTAKGGDAFDYAVGSTIYYHRGAAGGGKFTVTVPASDPESGIGLVAFPAIFGSDASVDATSPFQGQYTWDATSTAGGAFNATAVDKAGLATLAPFTVTPDTSAPASLGLKVNGGSAWAKALSVSAAWSAVDAGSGVATYDVQVKTSPAAGSFGSWHGFVTGASATSASLTGSPGNTYCFRQRAHDHVSNISSYTGPACVATPIDDASLTRTGTWTALTGQSADYLGTIAQTTQQGASLATPVVHALQVDLLATKCAACGTVNLLWNGTVVGSASLVSTTTKPKTLIPIPIPSGLQTGTASVVVTSSGKEVDVDGIGVYRGTS